ncbi:MAG: glycosyltransferase [Dongiaceae bacterium]
MQTVAIILTNYKRAQNLPRIVRDCLAAQHRPDVIVIDNAEHDRLRESLDFSSGRVDYRPNFGNLGAGHRFSVGAELGYDVVLAIDDDLFLTPRQIDRLAGAYSEDPGRIHGVWGENIILRDGRPFFLNSRRRINDDTDIINRAYAFGPALAAETKALVPKLGFKDWLDAAPSDDVLLSFSSERRPRIHNFGKLNACETSGAVGIAQWRQEDFRPRRWEAIKKLFKIRPSRAPEWFSSMR